MWEVQSNTLDKNVHKYSLFENESQLTYENVIRVWRENSEFREFYFSILEKSPFDAYFWEHPPVTTSNIWQAYEFVLVHSPQLSSVSADQSPFQEKFNSRRSNESILAFENLGRDAELIVPYPIAERNIYAHFASFIRNAPEDQKHDLFKTLANALGKRISNKSTWVSTSGLGVYWLHIRLDTRPKYYSYQPYRQYLKGDYL